MVHNVTPLRENLMIVQARKVIENVNVGKTNTHTITTEFSYVMLCTMIFGDY